MVIPRPGGTPSPPTSSSSSSSSRQWRRDTATARRPSKSLKWCKNNYYKIIISSNGERKESACKKNNGGGMLWLPHANKSPFACRVDNRKILYKSEARFQLRSFYIFCRVFFLFTLLPLFTTVRMLTSTLHSTLVPNILALFRIDRSIECVIYFCSSHSHSTLCFHFMTDNSILPD